MASFGTATLHEAAGRIGALTGAIAPLHTLARGEVITKDLEIVGTWRAVDSRPDADNEGGRYGFIAEGQTTTTFLQDFAFLDYRVSRGMVLSNLTRAIREWQESLLI